MEPFTMLAIYFGYRLFEAVAKNADSIVQTVVLAWQTVHQWLSARQVSSSDVGSLVKQQLANGSYRVVGGVFSNSGEKRQTIAWDCNELDYDLRQKLGGRDEIKLTF